MRQIFFFFAVALVSRFFGWSAIFMPPNTTTNHSRLSSQLIQFFTSHSLGSSISPFSVENALRDKHSNFQNRVPDITTE